MPLSRIALVNHALDMAGLDSSFQAKARNWLNIILEKLSDTTDYRFLNKLQSTATAFSAGVSSYTLPVDFKRADACYWYHSTGQKGGEILVVEPYVFDQVSLGISGFPTHAMIDEFNRYIIFNAAPSTSDKTFKQRYWRTVTPLSLDSTDDAVVPDFNNQDVLIQELIAMCHEHSEDEREMAKKAEVEKAHQKHQRNEGQVGASVIDLDRNVFRGRSKR